MTDDLTNPTRRKVMGLASMVGMASMMPPAFISQAFAAAKPLPAVPEDKFILGVGHVGPISDEGWTFSHHAGIEAVKAKYPKMKVLEVENIPFSADCTRIYRQMVGDGAQFVISSSNYGDLYYEVAKKAKNVGFMECDGHGPSDNVSVYYIQHWWPTYVVGVAAGMMSKKGKLGYVASYPVPSVYCSTNAFLMGARSVNPDATLQVVAINSWFDPQGAKQAGTALLDNGCDFLFGIMDEAAYLQVAEERGIPAAMWNTDIRRYGPKSYVSSIILDWKQFYLDQVTKRVEGKWAGGDHFLLGLGKGIDRDAWGQNVPMDVQKKADDIRDKMLKGEFNPFVGEIKDATGKVRVAKGKTMTAEELYTWDWSIPGVSGLKA